VAVVCIALDPRGCLLVKTTHSPSKKCADAYMSESTGYTKEAACIYLANSKRERGIFASNV
jgi:hypothetical protein